MQEFIVSFKAADFHHLAGLHKLRDNYELRRNRADALKWILDGDLKDSELRKSAFFYELKPRLVVLQNLEGILDSNDTIYRFLSSKCRGSQIEADWLLQNILDSRPVYVFLIRREPDNPTVLSCCSVFSKNKKDYTQQQPRYTLLKKTKRRLGTDEVRVLYER